METALIRVALLVGLIQESGDSSISDVEVTAWLEEALSYLVGTEVFTRDHSLAVDREVRNCANDVGCIADRSAAAGATHTLSTVVDLQSRAISLQLVDTRLRRVVSSGLFAIPEDETAAKKSAKARTLALFDEAGLPAGGRVSVRAAPADARVALSNDGKLSELPALLAPGARLLHISRDGYESVEREVTIVPGEDLAVEVSLSESPGIVESPWLWIGVGVAAVAAGVGTYFLARPRHGTLCQGDPMECQ